MKVHEVVCRRLNELYPGMSVVEFARRVGANPVRLSRALRGERDFGFDLGPICQFLGLSTEDFLECGGPIDWAYLSECKRKMRRSS